jgi:hypothetical protein
LPNFCELLERSGAIPPRSSRGKWRCPRCPERKAAMSVDVDAGLYHCHRCGWGGNRRMLEKELGLTAKPTRTEVRKHRVVKAEATRFDEWLRGERIQTATLIRELSHYEAEWRETGRKQIAARQPVSEMVWNKLREITTWQARAEMRYQILCEPEQHVTELLGEYRTKRKESIAA